jgi:2-amino-4-hydroxy-6-hydroxymethyldihydropteridine diphosphokinase
VRTLDVVVGLGSNLGDRLGHLQGAVQALSRSFDVRACSFVYETAPVGPPQPDYLNAAVRLGARATPEELLETLLSIERADGRVRTTENRLGARTIDLDILWIEGVVVATPLLSVPHPRLAERAFALLPLFDVAEGAIDPRTGAPFVRPREDVEVRRTELRLQPEPPQLLVQALARDP